jgi:hypothetical protein
MGYRDFSHHFSLGCVDGNQLKMIFSKKVVQILNFFSTFKFLCQFWDFIGCFEQLLAPFEQLLAHFEQL